MFSCNAQVQKRGAQLNKLAAAYQELQTKFAALEGARDEVGTFHLLFFLCLCNDKDVVVALKTVGFRGKHSPSRSGGDL